MTYGTRLNQSLIDSKKGRKALALHLGVTPQAIGMVITGGGKSERRLSPENTRLTADFLDVDYAWLATGEIDRRATNNASHLVNENISNEYGQRLKLARQHAKLTQMELSAKTGIPQSTISSAEVRGQGSSETPIFARACGVDVMWLTTGEGDMVKTTVITSSTPTESSTQLVIDPTEQNLKLSKSALKVAQMFDLMSEGLDTVEALISVQEAVMQSLMLLHKKQFRKE